MCRFLNLDYLPFMKGLAMKEKYLVYIILGSFLILFSSLIPYVYVFHHSSLSSNNIDWAAFGDYLSGVASFFNTLLFVCITIIIYRFDSNSKAKDILISHRKEIFTRFLINYELIVKDFYLLSINFAKSCYNSSLLDFEFLNEMYISLNTLSKLSNIYVPVNNSCSLSIYSIISIYLNEYIKPLMNSTLENTINQSVVDKIITANKEIDKVLTKIENIANTYILEDLK
jgi:hypothetical protein